MTFQALTPADFESRPYTPPLTDVDDILSSPPAQILPCLPEVDVPSPDEISRDRILVCTTYDRMLPMNKHFPAPRDREENGRWTEKERILAMKAEVVKDKYDLTSKLANFYPNGTKDQSRPYLRIPSAKFPK